VAVDAVVVVEAEDAAARAVVERAVAAAVRVAAVERVATKS
jgi:hypothetical protein